MAPHTAPAPAALHAGWQRQALLITDVVESVRLFRDHELDVTDRWQRFVHELRREVLPARGGRFVKSTGDGFLLAFDKVPDAATAALEIQQRIARYNRDRAADAALRLRVGLHVGHVTTADFDLLGDAVNVTHRVCTLAEPGEVLASAEASDELVQGVDPDAEDLGPRFVRHLPEPLRVYRIGAVQSRPAAPVGLDQLKPTVAVVPFVGQLGADPDGVVGDALADDVTGELARMPELHVISGLSARMLRGRDLGWSETAQHLGATYLVTGRYRERGNGLRLMVELVEVRSGRILWSETFETSVQQAFDPAAPLASEIAAQMLREVMQQEFSRAMTQPLPSLEAYSLLAGAVGLMHRLAPGDFMRARAMLDHLVDRLGRHAVPHAWLAKWYVLRSAQGWSTDAQQDTQRALDHVGRALDVDPSHSLALAIGGLVHSYLRHDLDTAERLYDQSLAAKPNESLARLFRSVLGAWRGRQTEAAHDSALALRLSPLDPMHYFYDSLAATALVAGPQAETSVELSMRSLRANRTHASTWRTLVFGLVRLDRMDEARDAVAQLRLIEPEYTVGTFRHRFPGQDGPLLEPWAQALQEAGLPP